MVELLSPTNKLIGAARQHYERKHLAAFGTLTHLREVDLLQTGQPLPMRGAVHPARRPHAASGYGRRIGAMKEKRSGPTIMGSG